MRTVELIYRYGSRHAQVRPRPQDAASARVRLNDGNRAFAALLDHFDETGGPAQRIVDVDPRDLGLDADHHAPSQHPFAAILGCSDARAPIELLFNEGPNELFVVRVAGNGLGADSLGSLSYAVEHLGESLRLIVILGHSGCGALTAAVDAFLEPIDGGGFRAPRHRRPLVARRGRLRPSSRPGLWRRCSKPAGIPACADRDLDRRQRRARRLLGAQAVPSRRSERCWGGLWRLSPGDARDLVASHGPEPSFGLSSPPRTPRGWRSSAPRSPARSGSPASS